MTEEFGATAWGRDWLRLAQPTSVSRPNPAIPRARSLARADRVRELDITPGRVHARVEDRTDRQVWITLPVWQRRQLDAARVILTDATGADLADDLHAALAEAGLSPAPVPDTMDTGCDCVSRARPCPHLLTVYFELARRVDEQPRIALALRGLLGSGTHQSVARIPIELLDPTAFYG